MPCKHDFASFFLYGQSNTFKQGFHSSQDNFSVRSFGLFVAYCLLAFV